MNDQTRKAEQFRALHIPGEPLVLFNIWDAGTAKAVTAGGAKAIATSSWSVANANGFTDGECIPLALAIENLRRIVGATDLPVTIDLEGGYGDRPEVVGETIALAIDAGAVGCNLEDSFPANGRRLRETVEQCDRIRRPLGRDELVSKIVDGSTVYLGQPGDLAASPVLTRELLESRSAPHTDRPLEGGNAVVRTRRSGDLIAEERRIDWTGEGVPGGTGDQCV